MKCILATILTLASLPCQAAICGLYQTEDFGERVLSTLTGFADAESFGNGGAQTLYTLTNPEGALAKKLMRGQCYCVSGTIQPDPEFEGDENYQLLTLSHIEGSPYTGCMPPADTETDTDVAALDEPSP